MNTRICRLIAITMLAALSATVWAQSGGVGDPSQNFWVHINDQPGATCW